MPYAKRLAEVRQRESPSIIKLSFRWVACTNFCTVDVDDLSQILALLSRFRFFTSAYYLGKCFSGRSSTPLPHPPVRESVGRAGDGGGGAGGGQRRKKDCITSLPFLTSERQGRGQPWRVGDNQECRCADQAHLQFLPPVACQARLPGEFFSRSELGFLLQRPGPGPAKVLSKSSSASPRGHH